jgi:CRISPR-associated endonuclease/helicase Cas3
MIALTTQVCEMSLDLSAALLVSEFAPLTSLIQRMGRCNRKLELEGTVGCSCTPPKRSFRTQKTRWQTWEAFIWRFGRQNSQPGRPSAAP